MKDTGYIFLFCLESEIEVFKLNLSLFFKKEKKRETASTDHQFHASGRKQSVTVMLLPLLPWFIPLRCHGQIQFNQFKKYYLSLSISLTGKVNRPQDTIFVHFYTVVTTFVFKPGCSCNFHKARRTRGVSLHSKNCVYFRSGHVN